MNKVSELSDDLEAVSVVLGGLKRELRTHRRFISTLLHIFHGITDFRESYKVKYNLENIICIIWKILSVCVCSLQCGENSPRSTMLLYS